MRRKEKNQKYFILFLATAMSTLFLMSSLSTGAPAWPEKNKLITIYIPMGAGGGADMAFRTLQPFLENNLGTKFTTIYKPGGSSQIGSQEYLEKAKPDGYMMLLCSLPAFPSFYLDPDRKATYSMKNIQLVANFALNPIAIAVKKGSRYKSLKDLIEAAKASPNKIKITAAGPLNGSDMAIWGIEKAAGVQITHMFFDQQGEQRAALLGGHVDAESNNLFELTASHNSGEIEVLAVFDDRPSKFLPSIKTAEAQGYKIYMYNALGFQYKAGVPKEIVDTMAAAIKKAEANPDFQKSAEKAGVTIRVMVGKEYANFWSQYEGQVKEVLAEMKKKR